MLAVLSPTEITLFALVFFASIVLLIAGFMVNFYFYKLKPPVSPYSGMPLRRASDLSFSMKERVLRFLRSFHQYDNRMIDLEKAALCRETGRIFPDAVNWFDNISLDWTFLNKRYPGQWVSWGSVSQQQQDEIRKIHDSLYGFQTDQSSSEPSPRHVEPEFALLKPGPLYVDLTNNVLMGWKEVPGTEIEVLIVQFPRKETMINLPPEMRS